MLPVVMLQPAADEFNEALDWFAEQTNDRSLEFAAQVRRASDRLGRLPHIGATVFGPARRVMVRNFDYVLIYIPYDDRVEIISVFHTRRDPAIWQARVDP